LISSVSAAVLSMAAIVSDGLFAKKRAGNRVAAREETVGNRVDALSPLVSASRTGMYIEDGMLTEHHLCKESDGSPTTSCELIRQQRQRRRLT
jgi:hypothetical protein